MQQSIVLPPPLFHSFALSLYTPLWHSQARPLAGSGRGLKRVLSLLSRLQARTLWSRPAPSRLADSGPGTAQILAVNKELANAAPTQRRTTAKWKVRFLLMFCLFFNALFLGAVGIKKLHEARAPRIMKILICACRKLNSIFSFEHAPKNWTRTQEGGGRGGGVGRRNPTMKRSETQRKESWPTAEWSEVFRGCRLNRPKSWIKT